MKYSTRYSSHLPVLLRAVELTKGPVLELGTGVFSTPVLHWLCVPHSRELVSYDNDQNWLNMFSRFQSEYHKLIYVDDWNKTDILRPWDVVFVDQSPGDRRRIDIARLANLAKYIVVHDTNGRYRKEYHYETVFPTFKYMWTFTETEPSTTVLSNFIDLKDFWIK